MITKNAMQLKALIKNKAIELNVAPQLVLQNYMLERLLERISKSDYADKFIIKGGFLLSSIVGLDTRATMDLDTTIKGFTLTKENLNEIVEAVCAIEIEDDITFEVQKIEDIRETDDYPGLRVFLNASYPPMRVPLTIDVTTGDVITPREIKYNFSTMFDEEKIPVWTYTLETVLAEKIETILARGIANTRPRDYYDVYVLFKIKGANIDFELLKQALEATTKKRRSEYVLDDFASILDTLKNSTEQINLWSKYQKSYPYAAEIDYLDTCDAVEKIMNKL